jgi:endonuclease III
VWRIGNEIVAKYDGDARNIWKGQSPDVVLGRLLELRVGEQISRMIVGALIDTEQIKGSGDVKVDIHVRRVLGRVLRGEGYSVKEVRIVIEKTREMYPKNPWMLDKPLYELGNYTCKAANPDCQNCYLRKKCAYYKNL